MKIAVIGTGKTGGEVTKLLDKEQIAGAYNEDNKPTADRLKEADVAIIFVPGPAVDDILDTVLESAIPAVWGSTGYDWPDDLDRRLQSQDVKWLIASNFSLGMNIARQCIRAISQGSEILKNPVFHIHEVHHTHKKDAPSGTALSWEKWLGREAEITSERRGDIKGIHRLHMETPSESIRLEHEAHDRAVFAEGAIWAARQIVKESVPPGFHDIETIFDKIMATGRL